MVFPKRVRCGQCSGCVLKDCGTCKHCVRKTKFGGDGSCKMVCIYRKCRNLQPKAANVKVRSATGNHADDIPDRPKKKKRLDKCRGSKEKTTTTVVVHGRTMNIPAHEYQGRPKGCAMCDGTSMEVLQTFASLSEMERVTGICRMAVGKACRKGGGVVDGYYFRHVLPDDPPPLMVTKAATSLDAKLDSSPPSPAKGPTLPHSESVLVKSNKRKRPYSSGSKDEYRGKPRAVEMSHAATGQVLQVFPSLSMAERETGVSRTSIATACRTQTAVKGLLFRRVDASCIPKDSMELDSSGRARRISSSSSPKHSGQTTSRPTRKPSLGDDMPTTTTSTKPLSFRPPQVVKPTLPKKHPPPLPKHMYGLPFAEKQTNVCGGCLGSRNEEAKDEPILLCDGPGCDREFHVGCTHLSVIPEGDFFCMDCDAYGTTRQLQQYLESHANDRADFETSRSYVEHLIQKMTGHKQKNRVPRSELWRISQVHDKTAKEPKEEKEKLQSGSKNALTTELAPEFLVGKPLQLYCPLDNNYHDGRIIDWRRANHLAPASARDDKDDAKAFYGKGDIARSEFLVRFSAGGNYRKQSLHCWIILEEHCIALGVDLIHAKYNHWGSSTTGWLPGQAWLRTTLELIPVCHLLDEGANQVSYQTGYDADTQDECWALTKVFGEEDRYVLLKVETEAIDYFSGSCPSRSKAPGSPAKKHDSNICRQMEIATALAFAEAQEQKRIRNWYEMPLNNEKHKQALTIVDEDALQPLLMTSGNNDDRIPRHCPLVEQGIDRLYIMELLQNRGVVRSLDTASSFSCQLVESNSGLVSKVCRETQKTHDPRALVNS